MILGFTFVHTVSVKTYLGTRASQPAFAAPVTVACYVQDVTDVVRTSDGQEATSTAKLNAPLTASPSVPAVAGQFTPGSEVTLPAGRVARVMKAARHDSGALALGLDHVQVWLT